MCALPFQMGLVRPGRQQHRGTRDHLGQVRWRKTLNTIRPHEEIDYVDSDYPFYRLLERPNEWDTGPEMWFELDMYWDLTALTFMWESNSRASVHRQQTDFCRLKSVVIPSTWISQASAVRRGYDAG
jgi:hypothetical protein